MPLPSLYPIVQTWYIYILYWLYQGVELSNDVEADALVQLSAKHLDRR